MVKWIGWGAFIALFTVIVFAAAYDFIYRPWPWGDEYWSLADWTVNYAGFVALCLSALWIFMSRKK